MVEDSQPEISIFFAMSVEIGKRYGYRHNEPPCQYFSGFAIWSQDQRGNIRLWVIVWGGRYGVSTHDFNLLFRLIFFMLWGIVPKIEKKRIILGGYNLTARNIHYT